jgi:alpha/beta superfamily hydrolase
MVDIRTEYASLGLVPLLLFLNGDARSQPVSDPYLILREAYAAGDAKRASEAYTEDAYYAELYDGASPLVRTGRAQIERGFSGLFNQFGPPTNDRPIDLNFRFASRLPDAAGSSDAGYYRIVIGKGDSAQRFYGRFATRIRNGKFVSDASSGANSDDFDAAPGPVHINDADEELSASFHDPLTGYFRSESCGYVITRSVRRLFAFDECSREWRGLNRSDGLRWTSGNAVIDTKASQGKSFDFSDKARSNIIVGVSKMIFTRQQYVRKDVTFGKENRLSGTLYMPDAPTEKRPGIVIVHGSGPQDRNGYASIIALLADHFVRAGAVVLTYDKRGVGGSKGNWASADFGALAIDAQSGMEFLKSRSEVDSARVGLVGSSQAGWVVAQAIKDGANPAFVMLIGAAGSALTVQEQNLYNTRVRMQCAGIPTAEITLALDQQRAFFAARRDPANASKLSTISAKASVFPRLRDWLFPAEITRSGGTEWYDVLDIDFDPLPIWKQYTGKAYFLFGSEDDSTPTDLAVKRLKRLGNNTHIVTKRLSSAQHLGLEASSLCKGELSDVSNFHREFFSTLRVWQNQLK